MTTFQQFEDRVKQVEDYENHPLSVALKHNIATYVAIAIMDLPNGAGKTWNEAQEIGAKVAVLSFASLDERSRPA